MPARFSSFAAGAFFFAVCGAEAAEVHGQEALSFRSGPAQVALTELYTSEGCSSCPPAEKWLGQLRQDKGLWAEFVPVAFHVNYWDHLGWRDALAAKAFTEREQAYAAAWGASSVYTPCFVRNGEEWRPAERRAPTGPRKENAGILTLDWQPIGNQARLDYRPALPLKAGAKMSIAVALLGGGIVNRIQRGENAGRELHHEFIALQFQTTPLRRDEAGGWSATVALPPRVDIVAARHAVAAWVTITGDLKPIQAVGGWLP